VATHIRAIFTGAVAVALVTAICYRYWLVAPVMRNVTLAEWRCVAAAVAAAIGVASSRFRLSAWLVALASAVGLLVGGTWTEYFSPNDIPVTLGSAFGSHLRLAWHEFTIWAGAIMLGAILGARRFKRTAA
jgi:hypothetical protein